MFLAGEPHTDRCVYIFADNTGNAKAIQQVRILNSDPAGTKKRFITYKVITWSAENAKQYQKMGISNSPFTVVLIGLDKGEKLRSHEPVTLAKLYDLIDNMAIRKMQIHYKH